MKRILSLALALAPLSAWATPDPADWSAVVEDAKGQTVHWHA
ncbi:ABC transporter substrate-binding protein, partial [Rhodobacteraceae bacterium R_SAG7]|nr:ABC transporter substrate-binding protein [Rhodobacteraceae bacterium R_SAG7]